MQFTGHPKEAWGSHPVPLHVFNIINHLNFSNYEKKRNDFG